MYPPLSDIIHKALLADRREPTGLLHCSSHSHWPLRFTQLSQVMPETENDFGSLITMGLGTLTHEWLAHSMEMDEDLLPPEWELKYAEWDVSEWLPEGWTGTCDYLFYHVPTGHYVVGDLKTAKPESLAYLNGKPKPEHTTQVSCYHAAITKAGRWPLYHEIFVCYLPKGKTAKQENVLPVIVTAPAEPSAWDNMVGIKRQVDAYLAEYESTGEIANKLLAPMPEPELKVYWNKDAGVWDVKQVAHWSETYIGAQFGEALCPKTPTAKIGHWTLDGYWKPRKGYGVPEGVEIPKPSKDEVERRRG